MNSTFKKRKNYKTNFWINNKSGQKKREQREQLLRVGINVDLLSEQEIKDMVKKYEN